MRVNGPANDTPWVLMEIRAAELATHAASSQGPFSTMDSPEYNGWLCAMVDECPVLANDTYWERHQRWAGWLAYQIVHHNDQ